MPTSNLQYECCKILASLVNYDRISENIRPQWLACEDGTRLEIDLFVEDMAVGFEIQGQQHYRYTERFHKTYADFEAQQHRDSEKRRICEEMGVRLYRIDSLEEMRNLVQFLRHKERSQPFTVGLPGIRKMIEHHESSIEAQEAEIKMLEAIYAETQHPHDKGRLRKAKWKLVCMTKRYNRKASRVIKNWSDGPHHRKTLVG